MKKHVLPFALILFFNFNFFAQQWQWACEKGNAVEYRKPVIFNRGGDIYSAMVNLNSQAGGAVVDRRDSDGTLQWSRSLGVQTNVHSLTVDHNKNVYVTGNSTLVTFPDSSFSGANGSVFFVLSLDVSGNRRWIKFFSTSFFAIANDNNNNIVLATDKNDKFLITKLSHLGTPISAVTHTCSQTNDIDYFALKCDMLNNVYLSGYFSLGTFAIDNINYSQQSIGGSNSFLVRMDPQLQITNVEIFQAAGLYDFEFDQQNNLYGFGVFASTAKIRQDTLELSDSCYTEDNCYEFYIVKLNASSTNNSWCRSLPGFYTPYLFDAISVSLSGAIYFTATATKYVGFNSVIVPGSPAFFVYKFSTNGVAQWAKQAAVSGHHCTSWAIACDETEAAVYIAGTYSGTPSFNNTVLAYSGPDEKYFIAKLSDQQFTGVSEAGTIGLPLTVQPNPSTGSIKIKCTAENYKLNLYNSAGILILGEINLSGDSEFDMALYPRGIYFLHVSTDRQTIVRKVVLE